MFGNLWYTAQFHAYSNTVSINQRFFALIKRTNGRLNLKMKNMTMKMQNMTIKFNRSIFTSLINIYLLYTDPKLVQKLYFIIRIILIVFSIYNFTSNNPILLWDLLESFNNNNLNQLHEDSFLNIKEGNIYTRFFEEFGQRPNNGPPRPNPNPNPLSGHEAYEAENSRRRQEEQNESGTNRYLTNLPPYIPVGHPERLCGTHRVWNMQFYYDVKTQETIFPEQLHQSTPKMYHNNTVRVYEEHGFRYIYDCSSRDESLHHCKVKYPDQSTITMYHPYIIANNVKYHKSLYQ